jgi:hypothetical protein
MRDDGTFILNTPNDGAAKFVSCVEPAHVKLIFRRHMPPNVPLPTISLPMYSVVLAKLFVSNFSCLEVLSQSQVKGEDRGIRPFVVQLSTGKALKPGVCSR